MAETPYISSESYDRGIFGDGSNLEARFVENYDDLGQQIEACRTLGLKIVLTSGTFDIIHVGHARYLEAARQCGDVLVVGIDSDAKVRERKGPDRPVVPQDERVEMLAHLRTAHLITLKKPEHSRWELIKRVRPDTLIATADTYSAEEVEALYEYCGRVIVLEPQAETSTTAKIRKLHVDLGEQLAKAVGEAIRQVTHGE